MALGAFALIAKWHKPNTTKLIVLVSLRKFDENDDTECASKTGVADGARTHDNRNHNPGLYQLSYSHRKNHAEL